jgi:hypothetical protein
MYTNPSYNFPSRTIYCDDFHDYVEMMMKDIPNCHQFMITEGKLPRDSRGVECPIKVISFEHRSYNIRYIVEYAPEYEEWIDGEKVDYRMGIYVTVIHLFVSYPTRGAGRNAEVVSFNEDNGDKLDCCISAIEDISGLMIF